MAFTDFPDQEQGVQLLQRSLAQGRVAHAYLFTGHHLDRLEAMARTLAKTLNCRQPKADSQTNRGVDCCDTCPSCRKIDGDGYADAHWVRPESKSRVITISQIRDLMQEIYLKPTEAEYKVAVIVAADRLNVQAANAFLKTLEEPPAKSVLILLSTDPQRLLETILSRCLRLNFSGAQASALPPDQLEWVRQIGDIAAEEKQGLLGRYRLLGAILDRLNAVKEGIQSALTERSPLSRYPDAEKGQVERWEEELTAAIEAEYRLQRAGLLGLIQWWLRDVWMQTLAVDGVEPTFPGMASAKAVAARITSTQAMENLQSIEQTQRLLQTNVQEALALEVGLLKLHL